MNKQALMKKLDTILDDAEKTRMFGNIEIVVRNGRAVVLNTTKTDKLDGENPYEHRNR